MTTTSRRWTTSVTAVAIAATAWLTPVAAAAAPTAPASASGVHTYAATPGDVASDRFGLSAAGTDVFVAAYTNRSNNRMHVARFASADASPTLTVTSSTPITSWSVYPERLYPADAVTVEGSTLTFAMSDTLRYAIVQINGADPGLAIINDPPEDPADVPDPAAANVVDLADFVTDSTGATDQTTQVVAAIDALYDDPSKDTLYVPDGWYQYAGLELRGRTKPVTIYVAEGALLKNRIQPTMTAMEPAIGIWDSANITISGRGVFDGNGFANYDTANGGWRHDAKDSHHQGGVMVVRSHDIVFNDTLMRDAKQWNWETHTASDVTFTNIKGLTPYAQPWVDGLDFASGQRLTVNGALTLGNDDTFASGHYNPDDGFVDDVLNPDRLTWDTADSSDIAINDHLGWSAGGGNGIRLGHSAYGHEMTDYTFTNVHYLGFSGGNTGITVQNSPDSGVRTYPRYQSLSIANSSFDTSKVATNFAILGKSSADPTDRIGQVTLDDVWFSQQRPARIENVTDLTVRDLTVAGQRVTRLTQTPLTFTNVLHRALDFPEDSAPVVEAVADQHATVGTRFELTAHASDADGDALTWSAGGTGLPSGSTLDARTGTFVWTPDASAVGTRTLVLVATDTHGASASISVPIVVTDPQAPRLSIIADTDTNAQTWNAEEAQNYGDNEHLRMLNFVNAARGPLGEGYAGGQANQDAKITFLSFDLAQVTDQLADAEIVSAQLSLTYFGPTKGALTGTNTLRVARAAGGWVEGDGKTTPTARTGTVPGALTWRTKPAVDTGTVLESAPFDVTASAKVGADSTYAVSQRPIGSTATTDVTAFVTAAVAEGQDLSLAVNETKKQDLIFVSTEGAARNPSAQGMAPTLTVTLRHTAGADTDALQQALDDSVGLGIADYSARTWAGFAQARATAEQLVDQPTATQADVDASVTALRGALSALEPALVSVSATVDRSAYPVGSVLDPTEIAVTATYADRTTGLLSTADWRAVGFDSATPGPRSVAVVAQDGLAATGAVAPQTAVAYLVLAGWDSASTYLAGDQVLFAGTVWQSSWWSRDQQPGDPDGPWQELRTGSDGIAVWTPSRVFVAGDVVTHDGVRYVARWWTRNQVPGDEYGPWASLAR